MIKSCKMILVMVPMLLCSNSRAEAQGHCYRPPAELPRIQRSFHESASLVRSYNLPPARYAILAPTRTAWSQVNQTNNYRYPNESQETYDNGGGWDNGPVNDRGPNSIYDNGRGGGGGRPGPTTNSGVEDDLQDGGGAGGGPGGSSGGGPGGSVGSGSKQASSQSIGGGQSVPPHNISSGF